MFSSLSRRLGYRPVFPFKNPNQEISQGHDDDDDDYTSPTAGLLSPRSTPSSRPKMPYGQLWQNEAPALSHAQSRRFSASPSTRRQSNFAITPPGPEWSTLPTERYRRLGSVDGQKYDSQYTTASQGNRRLEFLQIPPYRKPSTHEVETVGQCAVNKPCQDATASIPTRRQSHAVRNSTHRTLSTHANLPNSWHQKHDYSTELHANTKTVSSRLHNEAAVARHHYSQRHAQMRRSVQKEHGVRFPESQGGGVVDHGLMREAARKAAEDRRDREKKRGRPHMRRNFAGVGKTVC